MLLHLPSQLMKYYDHNHILVACLNDHKEPAIRYLDWQCAAASPKSVNEIL